MAGRFLKSSFLIVILFLISTSIYPGLANNLADAQTQTAEIDGLNTDFNGDGYADLVIGSIGDVGFNVLYGSSSGLQTSSPDEQFLHQNTPGVEDQAEVGGRFGTAVVSGDYNGDGKDDLAVGAPFDGISGIADAGVVNVIYGSSTGISATAISDQLWNQDSPGVEGIAEPSDGFGYLLGPDSET